MRSNFKYILQDEKGDQLARINLPFVLNIGTQFEDPHSRATFEVYKIVKESPPPIFYSLEIKFYCRQINSTPWVYDHLKASQYAVLNKAKGVNA